MGLVLTTAIGPLAFRCIQLAVGLILFAIGKLPKCLG